MTRCSALPVNNAQVKHLSEQASAQKRRKTTKPKTNWWELHSETLPTPCGAAPREGQVAVGSIESLEKYPGLRPLTLRQLDTVKRQCPGLPETRPRLIEVSQSGGRHTPVDASEAKTFLPKGILIHTGLGRTILGVEKLRIQGLWLPIPQTQNDNCFRFVH